MKKKYFNTVYTSIKIKCVTDFCNCGISPRTRNMCVRAPTQRSDNMTSWGEIK